MSATTSDLPPAPPFAMGLVATELYTSTAPLTYDEVMLGYPWALYLTSLGLELEDEMVLTGGDATHEPWTAMADPERVPETWLGTLAQWAGLRKRSSYSTAELRQLIGPHAPGLWRGTKDALIAAARRFIGPDQPLYFEERADGDAYFLRCFTYDFSGGDPVQIEAALVDAKPAGITLDYEQRIGQTYGMMLGKRHTYAAAKAAYPTYAGMLEDTPT